MLVPKQVHRAIDDREFLDLDEKSDKGRDGERFNLFGIRKTN